MPYLIDGHNLIPNIPGLSLKAIDDEEQLIKLLQEFCRIRRKSIEVYFDNAPSGHAGKRNFGAVTAWFVSRGKTADSALIGRVIQLGGNAPNWTVVTSDASVVRAVRFAGARTITSQEFAALLLDTLSGSSEDTQNDADRILSAEEVDQWLEIFSSTDNEE